MKLLLFAIGGIALSISINAQEKEIEFGDVAKEEIQMRSYQPDTTAAAIILFDKGETRINPSSTTSTIVKHHRRIKLFKQSAFEDWGSVTLFAPRGRLLKIKGATYHYDSNLGKVITTEMEDEAIFKSHYNKFIDKISFALPNLKEGSVIEYSYVEHYAEVIVQPWDFQHTIPVKYSEYLVENYFSKLTDLRGTLQLTNYEPDYKKKFERFVMKDIPAFKEEPFMTHEENHRSKIYFWNSRRSWSTITKNLLADDNFGNIITGHNYLKKQLAFINDTTAEIEKIKLVSKYVKDNVRWNGNFDYYGDEPKIILEKKSGSSGDINLLLASMLYKIGIDVRMVLISTRNHGITKREYPSLIHFNDVLCLAVVGKDSILLDATEKMLPFNILPTYCLNYEGLAIQEFPLWVNLTPPTNSKISVTGNFQLSETGTLSGTLTYRAEGYAALNARKEFIKKGEEDYIKDFIKEKKVDLQKSTILNMEEYKSPVQETYEVIMTEPVAVAGDMIYLNPYLALREETNPFKEEKRSYPIDFVIPIEKNFMGAIIIPDGYVVEELPSSKIVSLPDKSARYMFNILQTGNKLSITTRFQQKKTMYAQEEYPALKEFYNVIISKKSEQVVLKKIKP